MYLVYLYHKEISRFLFLNSNLHLARKPAENQGKGSMKLEKPIE